MRRIEGRADDVEPHEGLQLEERVKRLLAARIEEELGVAFADDPLTHRVIAEIRGTPWPPAG